MDREQVNVPKKDLLQPGAPHFPIFKLEAPHQPISDDVVQEIERAAEITFGVLRVDTQKYYQGIRFEDLIDPWEKNEQNLHTFPRRNGVDNDMLAIVVSTLPVYDSEGREVIALETKSNVLFVNLRRIDDQFIEGAHKVPLPIKAGIAAVEEVIHHIQHNVFGRAHKGNTDTMHDPELHLQDEIEQEAAPLKKEVYKVLYPRIDIKVKGVDY